MAKEKKKIVRVEEETESKASYGKDKHGKIVQLEDKGDPKARAKKFRMGSVVCWLLAIIMEALALLFLAGKIPAIGSFSTMTMLIGFIILDLVFFIPGAIFWKKANHMDPISEKNKVQFFLWNQLGLIIAILAFVPFIVVVLMNKELDKKTKSIVSAVAAVALVIAGFTGIDFNPVSSEDLARAEAEVSAVSESGFVYWAPNSKKYHVDADCPAFSRSETVYEGTVAQAFENNLTDPCRRCIPAIETGE